MDQTGMLALILILVLAAFALYRIWKGKRKRKDHQKQLSRIGNFGEARLRSNLSDIPEPKRILRHLYLPVGNGDQTTEIDLLMIHRTGIYVFESKNYSGYVKGKERKKKWIQITRSGIRPFYNPIMQNAGHIRALKRILSDIVDRWDYYSIIVFGDECRIRHNRIKSRHTYIIRYQDVKELCDRLAQTSRVRYSEKQIEQIAKLLSEYIDVKKKVMKQHARDIERNYTY